MKRIGISRDSCKIHSTYIERADAVAKNFEIGAKRIEVTTEVTRFRAED